MISSQQYRKLMKSYQKEPSITQSAIRAGLDRKTAAKYVHGAPGPEEVRPARHWRTRADAFVEIWPEIEVQLWREPQLHAKTLFEQLLEQFPGQFSRRQRRTFERRIRRWKKKHGVEPELFFSQQHQAGERLQLDWFHAKELEVSIGQERLEHLFVHVVLPYSNWEWARVCFSESFLSLKRGLQSALFELGAVPDYCQTDASSTATHRRGRGSKGREYNERYAGLLAHFGLRPALIGVREPHENGDVESGHRHLRQGIDQALRLRGSRHFGSIAEYESFVFELLRRRNAERAGRLAEERERLRPLVASRLADYEEEPVRVSREALVRVGKQTYSLPARYAGEVLRARLYETEIEFWWDGTLVERSERPRGERGTFIDWRHMIGALLRKPGALKGWRHREAMFPNLQWRALYDQLVSRYSPGRAEREYLGILALGLEHRLEVLEQAISELGDLVSLDRMRQRFQVPSKIVEPSFRADLSGYDQLLFSKTQTEEAA